MTLVRRVPFELAGDGFDDLIRRTFGDFGSSLLRTRTWSPSLDAFVDDEELHVRVELPGIDPDADVEIEVENGVLRVSGERKQERSDEGEGWYRREMQFGRFERHVGLPEGVDPESVRASYEAGILDISIPLPAKPKTKVKVDVGHAPNRRPFKKELY
jgi:HSP20 family protein